MSPKPCKGGAFHYFDPRLAPGDRIGQRCACGAQEIVSVEDDGRTIKETAPVLPPVVRDGRNMMKY